MYCILVFLCSEFKLENIYSGVNLWGKNVRRILLLLLLLLLLLFLRELIFAKTSILPTRCFKQFLCSQRLASTFGKSLSAVFVASSNST